MRLMKKKEMRQKKKKEILLKGTYVWKASQYKLPSTKDTRIEKMENWFGLAQEIFEPVASVVYLRFFSFCALNWFLLHIIIMYETIVSLEETRMIFSGNRFERFMWQNEAMFCTV